MIFLKGWLNKKTVTVLGFYPCDKAPEPRQVIERAWTGAHDSIELKSMPVMVGRMAAVAESSCLDLQSWGREA